MADQTTPIDAMADIVRGRGPADGPALQGRIERSRNTDNIGIMRTAPAADARPAAVAPPTSPTLGQVLQAYDEILKRLESAKMQSDEVRSATTRATLPNSPKQASIADLEGGTIFDQLAARAVMISRVAEEIEHNLALSLSAMR